MNDKCLYCGKELNTNSWERKQGYLSSSWCCMDHMELSRLTIANKDLKNTIEQLNIKIDKMQEQLNKSPLLIKDSSRTKINNYIINTKESEINLINSLNISDELKDEATTLIMLTLNDLYIKYNDSQINDLINEYMQRAALKVSFKTHEAYTEAIKYAKQLRGKYDDDRGFTYTTDFKLMENITWSLAKANKHYYGPYMHKDNWNQICMDFILKYSSITDTKYVKQLLEDWKFFADINITPFIVEPQIFNLR